jgi:hypothetical protein
MRQSLIALLVALVAMQAQAQSALELLNIGLEVPSLEEMNSAPVAKGEKIVKGGLCGEIWVSSPQADGGALIRSTYQKQRPAVIAFCWLDEIRSQFNAAQRRAEGTGSQESVTAFVRTAQLEAVSDPKSYYNRVKNIYCANGGTFFMDLTNEVRECPAK